MMSNYYYYYYYYYYSMMSNKYLELQQYFCAMAQSGRPRLRIWLADCFFACCFLTARLAVLLGGVLACGGVGVVLITYYIHSSY
jgi:hypothetical protein